MRYSTRFVIVTDYQELLAVDTKTQETLAIPIFDIDKHYTFFAVPRLGTATRPRLRP